MTYKAGKKTLPVSLEFLFQWGALVIIVVLIHAVYLGVVRPNADAILAGQAAAAVEGGDAGTERSFYVLIRDLEQEACFVLLFWALAMMAFKAVTLMRNRALLHEDLLPLAEGVRILPEDTRELSRRIEALPRRQAEALPPRALLAGLQRFRATRNVQDVASATHAYCSAEGERLEAELSMIRYIAWAIPSIGFIGTVRGIGDALGQAHKALEGNIFGVTRSLGVAFNSTLIALVLSIVLMFMLHQLQLLQDRYVLETEAFCEDQLTRHLHAP